jgi:DHA3 family macrolide efflux protein-like MFS transporter
MGKAFNRDLALLLSGQFVSQIGDKFYALALAFWVLRATGSPAQMGIVLFASMIPSVILGFFVGGFIDRHNRKAILVAADVIRAAAVASVTIVYYLDGLSLAAIIAVQVLLSAASAFFNPAAYAVVPQIVPGEKLVKANAASQFLSGAANIAGPVLGGLAVSYLGYAFVFAFNALSFLLSAACEAAMRVRPPAARESGAHAKATLSAGYSHIFRQRRVVALLGVVAVVHFFVGSIQVVMPVLANTLAGDGARNLGYIETAFGLGAVDNAMAGRVFGIVGSVGNFTLPLSVLVFGGLLNVFPSSAITAACGLFLLLVCPALAWIYKQKETPLAGGGKDV